MDDEAMEAAATDSKNWRRRNVTELVEGETGQ